ncbi:MAG: linear amide C-N hydrolase [Clostridia bacterium]|nr:linear amide C-N hydrolase [Clostridia bacterium]
MKKSLKISLIIILLLLVLITIILIVLFRNELKTLKSFIKIDDYGMYKMTYYGDYGFDDFLKQGATNDKDIEKFVTKKLLKGIPIKFNVTDSGCTAFITKNENKDIIFARNFDFTYAPSMQLYTNPQNGYSSVSTVNLSFIGYSEDYLPTKGISLNNFLTLSAPYLPFDGMNEKGVTIALLAVPEVQMESNENKITLNTTTAIRLVLDKASNVDEAIELLKNYNIYFSADVYCHYLIADSTGKSVIVEYYDNDLQVIETDKEYQVASNFIAYNNLNIGEGYTEFNRYDKVVNKLEASNNSLNINDTINLLNDVGVYDKDGFDKLQWSVVYNLTNKSGIIWAHRNKSNIIDFELN